jgi:hypothetical protein
MLNCIDASDAQGVREAGHVVLPTGWVLDTIRDTEPIDAALRWCARALTVAARGWERRNHSRAA